VKSGRKEGYRELSAYILCVVSPKRPKPAT